MVHVVESTVSRRYAGWFVRNAEHAQRVFEGIRKSALPAAPKSTAIVNGKADGGTAAPQAAATAPTAKAAPKVAWGAVKVA